MVIIINGREVIEEKEFLTYQDIVKACNLDLERKPVVTYRDKKLDKSGELLRNHAIRLSNGLILNASCPDNA